MAITVGCVDCGWVTDIELISETNPHHCPECGGEIMLCGQNELSEDPLYVDGELNPILYQDEERGRTTMAHPWTSDRVGFRVFDGTSFGELTETGWCFDGTEDDVRNFVIEHLGQDIESFRTWEGGTYDVIADGVDYRIYTRPH